MRQKSGPAKEPATQVMKNIRRAPRRHFSAEDKSLDTQPDMQISRIRLSDKTSRLHPRHVVPKPGQTYDPHRAGSNAWRVQYPRGLCRRVDCPEPLLPLVEDFFLEAGKKRLAGDTARAATSDEVKAA